MAMKSLSFRPLPEARHDPRSTRRFRRGRERGVCATLRPLPAALRDGPHAARRLLNEADWAELDAAFAANRDPLTGHSASQEYEPLFKRIVMTAPAPIGLG